MNPDTVPLPADAALTSSPVRAFLARQFTRDTVSWKSYFAAIMLAVTASALVYALERLTIEQFSNISGFLILAVLISAVLFGSGPALVTAVTCSFLYDWLMVPPFFGTASSTDNLIKFTLFVTVALLTSWIAGAAKSLATQLKRRETDLIVAISEQRRLESAREQEAIQRQAEALRNAILTSVSHDLKTPLAGIIGAISSHKLFGDTLSARDKAELLDSVLNEATKLHGYLENMLEVARLEDRQVPMKREAVHVDDVIDLTLKRLAQQLKHHRICIDPSCAALAFTGDERLMDIALGNLLGNAAKFSAPGSAITVSAGLSPGDQCITINIDDEGVGVPDEESERVFEKFHRVNRTDSVTSGTGLGLWISRRIVEAHAGTLKLQGREGQRGTRVRVTLPLATLPPLQEPALLES